MAKTFNTAGRAGGLAAGGQAGKLARQAQAMGVAPSFAKALRIKAHVRKQMRFRPLNVRISEFQIKWLTEKAKYVRVAMRGLLNQRRGGRVSAPGQPPTKRVGFIYKMTLYAVDRVLVQAVIGPLLKRASSQKICGILDRGGVERLRISTPRKSGDERRGSKVFLARYRARPFTRPGLIKGLREYNDKRMAGKL